jgi:hypothetical protein
VIRSGSSVCGVRVQDHEAGSETALTAALYAYGNDAQLLKRAIRAAGGVLTLSWAGSLPTRVGDRDRPTQFQGTITVRIEDLPESDPEGRS